MEKILEQAIEEIKKGNPVILLDDPKREGEGDFVLAAHFALDDPGRLQYHLRFGAEFCVALPQDRLNLLRLPQAPLYGRQRGEGCNSYERVDAKKAHSGISAQDRALAIDALVFDLVPITHQNSRLATHGHTTPLGAAPGGVLQRPGHTEGSLELVYLAGFSSGAVIAEVKDPETGDPMKGDQFHSFAREHNLVVLPMQTLIEYRKSQQ